MWRPFAAVAGLCAALVLEVAPACAFEEQPAPPQPSSPPGQSTPQANPPALGLGTPPATANSITRDSKGLHVFGYDILPSLDFGLDLLYGEDQQLDLQGPVSLDGNDVTVLGKVKRRF
jgi:hypothetical protein